MEEVIILDYSENEYMYIKYDKVNKLMKIFICIKFFLIVTYFSNPYIALNLSTVIETILIFTITFIATSVFKFSRKFEYKIISFFLLIVALLKFSTLIYLVVECCESQVIEYVKLKSIAMYLILESIYCFILVVYVKKAKFINTIGIYIIALIAILSSMVKNIYIFWIMSLLLFIVILFQFSSFKLIKDKSINHIKLLVILNIISVILDILTFKFGVVWLLFINDIIKIFVYILIYIWISDMAIKKPSENLNKSIAEKNLKINKQNKRIESSNEAFKSFNEKIILKENYFKDFLENIPKAIVVLNANNLSIFQVNKEFAKEFNLENKKEIIGKNIFDLIKFDNEKIFLLTRRAVGYALINGEERFWNIEILTENNENLILFLENISVLKQSEKIRGNFNKKNLEEQIKNDFLSSISHDLKTPINVIYTSIQLQKKILEGNSLERIEYYNQVNKENCITLMRLANNLIDSSKLDCDYLKPNLNIYNIVDLVEKSIEKLSEYIKDKELEYIFDTDEEEIYVKCDQEFMQRIVINLISNSIKHTKYGGICVNIKSNLKRVFIEFSDTGEGMEKEFLDRAFDKYYKDEKRKGLKNKSTGIGLYIVKNLVELQNAKIKIESIKHVGTNIRLEFNRENNYEL